MAKDKSSAADKPSSSVSVAPKITEFHKSKLWWFMTAALAVALFVYGGYRKSGSGAKVETGPLTVTKSITVELRPDRWSEWINILPGAPFVVDSPAGWHRYEFWGGEQRVVEKQKAGERPRWFGSVPSATFRLKGEAGKATISWDEPRQ